MLGMRRTLVGKATRWDNSSRMSGDCMICMATSTSGCTTGMRRLITKEARHETRVARQGDRTGLIGAAVGGTMPGPAGQRVAAALRPTLVPLTPAFAWQGQPSSASPVADPVLLA